jgi:hypothetical protein
MFDECSYIIDKIKHKEIHKAVDKHKFLGNRKCHINSLDYAISHKNVSKILGCIQVFNEGDTVAHFVVKLNDGTIIDPTYGRMSSRMYKHLVIITEYDINTFEPTRELNNLKEYIYDLLPWYVKLFKSPNDF